MPLTQGIRERRADRRRRALTRAVWDLAPQTRQAMLAALDDAEIIAGAYTDRRGRTCPMLAAYRRGARLGGGAFPRAWDAFAEARRPRLATCRELDILRAILEESLPSPVLDEPSPTPPMRQAVASAA